MNKFNTKLSTILSMGLVFFSQVCVCKEFKILELPIVSPEVTKIKIEECGDKLIDVTKVDNKRIVPLTVFDKKYTAGHDDFGKVRVGLYEHLQLLLKYLPESVGLAIFEGLRPLWKQKEYFVKKFKELKTLRQAQGEREIGIDTDKKLTYEDLEQVYSQTSKLVSPFIDNIPVHCTGAAIDFMPFKFNEDGSKELLDLGKFGVIFGENKHAQTLSENVTDEQKKNRYMLLAAAAKAGLVNYGYEWWHYSYGDRAWALVEGKEKAMYGLAVTGKEEVLTKEEFLKSFLS